MKTLSNACLRKQFYGTSHPIERAFQIDLPSFKMAEKRLEKTHKSILQCRRNRGGGGGWGSCTPTFLEIVVVTLENNAAQKDFFVMPPPDTAISFLRYCFVTRTSGTRTSHGRLGGGGFVLGVFLSPININF